MKLIVLLSVTLLTGQLWADDSFTGCGPGWYVAKENSMVSGITRVTTNSVCGLTVVGGMSTGSSNCAKHPFVQNGNKKALDILAFHFMVIKKEISLGQGPFLTSFTDTLGCNSIGRSELTKNLRNQYTDLKNNYEDAAKAIHGIMRKNQAIESNCKKALL